MDFCSFFFVCTSYKSTFLNRSDNTWRHLRLHIMSPSPPSSALPATYFPCRMTAQTCQPTQSRACLRCQHACLRETIFSKILHVFRPLSPIARACVCVCVCVCVFTATWLHIPDISYFAIHMGPSSLTFSMRFVVSAHSRVCVRMYLNPRDVTSFGHFDLRYCNTFPLTHLYSLQHPLLLMLSLSLLWSSFSLYQKITPTSGFAATPGTPASIPYLTLILLTSNIGWAPNNASKWQMGFNLAFNP